MCWLKRLLFGEERKQFTYGQRVEIVGGFYAGHTGMIRDEPEHWRKHHWEVLVDGLTIMGSIQHIHEQHLTPAPTPPDEER